MSTSRPSTPWFHDGLQFTCSRCGDCCRGPGYVWVDDAEIGRLAAHLEMSIEAFGRSYLRDVSGRTALIDNPDGDCIFWTDGCSVYAARPGQCRTFPFWEQNLFRPQSWERTAEQCPGAGEGRLYRLGEIQTLLARQGETVSGDRGSDPD